MTTLQPTIPLLPTKGVNESAEAFLARLMPPLNATVQLLSATLGGVAVTVYDTQGRPIQTPDGNFAYGADGSTVVAPDIVQIDTQDIVDAAVGEDQVADLAIGTAKIKDAAIVTAKIGLLQVVTANIDDAAINNAKIANVSAGKLTAGTISTNGIFVGASSFELDGTNTVLKIKDTQGSPVTRVELGKLSSGSTAYGLTLRDASGNIILQSGSSSTISGTFIDTIAANQVTAGTFTGFTFQTAGSAARSVLSASNNRLECFNSGGTLIAGIGSGSTGGTVGAYSFSSLEVSIYGSNSGGGACIYGTQTGSFTGIAAVTGFSTNNLGGDFQSSGTAALQGLSSAAVNAGFFKNTTGSSGGHGLRGQSTGGGSGIIGVAAAQGAWSFYDETGGGYGPFTGAHDALVLKTETAVPGDLVVGSVIVARAGWSDAISSVIQSSSSSQLGAVGVLIGRVSLEMRTAAMRDLTDEEFAELQADYDLATVNAVGEGLMVVCGEGGDLGNGDLLVTSSTVAVGMKQADDILHSYTVAKSREAVTFASPTETKTLAVFYVSG